MLPRYYPGIAPVALRYQKGVPLPKNLGLPESCRRFSLSHSEGEKAGVKGPSWGLGAHSASNGRGVLLILSPTILGTRTAKSVF